MIDSKDLRARMGRAMADAKLDALVAMSPENVIYSSGTSIITQRMIPDRLALVLWGRDGDQTFIVCTIEEAQARAESWISDIRGYVEFAESPIAVLATALEEKGLSRGRIGIEMRYLVANYYRELVERLPEAELVAADDVFDRVRMIKTPSEVELIGKAFMATDRVIRSVFEESHIGSTEKQMVEMLEQGLKRAGADSIAFTVLATGANALMAHPAPSDMAIAPGCVLRTDSGGSFKGYYSDVARTAIASPVSARQRKSYEGLVAVQEKVIAAMKPGVRACDLFHMCKAGFEEHGLVFTTPHIGHGIGLSVHEFPMISPLTTEVLQPGMLICIEPVYRGEEGIYHTEDLVLVTEGEPKVLSRSANWSELLVLR